MQITASTVREGDVIRGIGLVVEYVEPVTDYTTHIAGYVVPERAVPDSRYAVEIALPNEHKVNVRRLFAVGDVVTIPGYEWDDDSDEDYVRAVVRFVYPEQKLLTVAREGDPTDNDVTSVPFFRARHAA